MAIFSERTRKIVDLALSQVHNEEDTDSDVDSDDSYVPETTAIVSHDLSDYEDDDVLEDVLPHSSSISRQETMPSSPKQNTSSSASPPPPQDSSDEEEFPRSKRRHLRIEDDEDEEGPEATIYFGKKRCITWSSEPVVRPEQAARHNIIKVRLQKLTGPAMNLGMKPSADQVWRLFFTPEIVNKIVTHTNAKLDVIRSKLINTNDASYKVTSQDEIYALFGLLIFCSIFKSSREALSSLFSTTISGRPIFRAIMTEKGAPYC